MPRVFIDNLPVNARVEGAAPDAILEVQIDAPKVLAIGPHNFQLEVVDDAGNKSAPVVARVVVTDTVAPTAVITAPKTVPFGASFTLSGASSVDIGGKIVKYIWTRLD